MGWLEPTDIGERLMPVLSQLGEFHQEITRETSERSLASGAPISPGRRRALACQALQYRMTEDSGLAPQALELELRDEAGAVIPTADIGVQDTEYLLALTTDEEDIPEWEQDQPRSELAEPDEFSAALIEMGIEDESLDESALFDADDFAEVSGEFWEEPDVPRYQILVQLRDPFGVPIPERWKDDPFVREMFDALSQADREGSTG